MSQYKHGLQFIQELLRVEVEVYFIMFIILIALCNIYYITLWRIELSFILMVCKDYNEARFLTSMDPICLSYRERRAFMQPLRASTASPLPWPSFWSILHTCWGAAGSGLMTRKDILGAGGGCSMGSRDLSGGAQPSVPEAGSGISQQGEQTDQVQGPARVDQWLMKYQGDDVLWIFRSFWYMMLSLGSLKGEFLLFKMKQKTYKATKHNVNIITMLTIKRHFLPKGLL